MKYVLILWIGLGIVCMQCQNTASSNPPSESKPDTLQVAPAPPTIDTLAEKQALETVFKEFYRRLNTMCRTPDFEPVAGAEGNTYVELNSDLHQKRLRELHATALLDSLFLTQYDALFKRINRQLKSGELRWTIGELPPFGHGANPWINAQDHPDAYWNLIQVQLLTINPKHAQLTWSWGDDFHYPAEAVKTQEGWKISRLAGFDVANFFQSATE